MPPSRPGVDLWKLARQFARYGRSLDGMPPLEVTRCARGQLLINDGVTRATRAYRYAGAGAVVPVVVTEERPAHDVAHLPLVSEAR